MDKGLRLTQTWMERGLWLVALLFAGFLIGLGGKVVDNLQQVSPVPPLEHFIDPVQRAQLDGALATARTQVAAANDGMAQAEQQYAVAASDSASAQSTFDNWLAARRATQQSAQDPEVLARTRQLDLLRAAERRALAAVQAQQQAMLNATQAQEHTSGRERELRLGAQERRLTAQHKQEMRVFLYRLALTLPLLVPAGWLFVRQRKSRYWPFVWGFIFFALFAFFVELVPYLPSYGGYVRYIVGIIITVLVGRYAITFLQAYLDRQKLVEAQPEVMRRETMGYDTAMARLAKSVCPGCERSVTLNDGRTDFCPHCGIGLYNHCPGCSTRKNAFGRFCFSCGTAAAP